MKRSKEINSITETQIAKFDIVIAPVEFSAKDCRVLVKVHNNLLRDATTKKK